MSASDVDTIVRDLVDDGGQAGARASHAQARARAREDAAEDRILDVLVPPARDFGFAPGRQEDNTARQTFRKRLREGRARRQARSRSSWPTPSRTLEVLGPQGMPGMEEMAEQIKGLFSADGPGKRHKTRKMKIGEALPQGHRGGSRAPGQRRTRSAAKGALANAEQATASCSSTRSTRSRLAPNTAVPTSRRQGVQRDLLPLVEGTTVNTKYGMVQALTTCCSSPAAPSTSPSRATSSPSCRAASRSAWS